ncbi:trigger factor [Candidatus Synechococcus spongiarum]|uniref:Trigger factor n=1 Tax=Candidatus Synechococcus spongiarum TaxID=431041 RepID=A0A171DGJ0_9SYNE|nr:trigger factor [Candidatus Synechococcus spongiarum]SAY38816.1 Cell division trigger factor (EC 5.2.1.8) [Candidatus Synechococcus spongiarum]
MASDLQVKTSPRPQSRLALEVLVPAERCQRSYDKALRNLCRTVRLPGFRPGRVPQTAVLQQLGTQQVWITVLEQLLEDTAREVLNDEDLDLLGKLQLQDSFDALAQQFKPGESLILNMEADVRPNATLKAYRDLDVEVEELSVEDLLEDVLERERFSASTTVPVEKTTAEMGDVAVVHFSLPSMDKPDEPDESDEADQSDGDVVPAPVSRDVGNSQTFDLDLVENHEVLPKVVSLIVGMTVGETKAIVEDTDEPGNGDKKGGENDSPGQEDADQDNDPIDELMDNGSITLCGLKARQLPYLDDVFAQKVSEFATMAQWKDALRRKLEIRVREENKDNRQDALVNLLCEDMEVELPQSLLEQEMEGVTEDFRNECRARGLNSDLKLNDELQEKAEAFKSKEARHRLQRKLALEAVAKAEQLTVADTELDERVRAMRRQLNSKQARKLNPVKLRVFVKRDLLREKAMAWLEEHNTFKVQETQSNPAPELGSTTAD